MYFVINQISTQLVNKIFNKNNSAAYASSHLTNLIGDIIVEPAEKAAVLIVAAQLSTSKGKHNKYFRACDICIYHYQ